MDDRRFLAAGPGIAARLAAAQGDAHLTLVLVTPALIDEQVETRGIPR